MLRAKLIEARGLVERGWIKGAAFDGVSGYCALGACQMVAAGDAWRVSDLARAMIVALKAEMSGWDLLTGYNDAVDTEKKDILMLFDKAIAHAD